MFIKDNSVKLDNLHIKMRKVLSTVEDIWDKYGEEAVITAGTEAVDADGKFIHSLGSLHPFGRALDFRTRYFVREMQREVANDLRYSLGNDYDVVLHKSHIHIEFDPK